MIIGEDHASVDGNVPPDYGKFTTAVRAAGGTPGFAIFRGAYGTWPDPTVRRDWHAAQAAGLVTGAYLFLRMRTDQPPEDQVHVFADNVGALRVNDFVPIIDVEDTGFTAEAELAWLHRAWTAMRGIYGVSPMFYTSDRVWTEDLHNLPAGEMIDSPLWVAKPWPWPVHTPAHLNGVSDPEWSPTVPRPWGADNAWLHQYQGDAVPAPGFSNTVDLSRFLLMTPSPIETGARVGWVQRRLGIPVNFVYNAPTIGAVRSFQQHMGLMVDGVIGPQTFTRLCWSGTHPIV